MPAEDAEAAAERWRARTGARRLLTSAATGRGPARAARRAAAGGARGAPPARRRAPRQAEHRVYRPGAGDGFRVERTGERAFRVSGRGVERLLARHDLGNEEALRYLEERLRDIGVIKALRPRRLRARRRRRDRRHRVRAGPGRAAALTQAARSLRADSPRIPLGSRGGQDRRQAGLEHRRRCRRRRARGRAAARSATRWPRATTRATRSCWSPPAPSPAGCARCGCRCGPRRWTSCRPPRRWGRGTCTAPTTTCCGRAACRAPRSCSPSSTSPRARTTSTPATPSSGCWPGTWCR